MKRKPLKTKKPTAKKAAPPDEAEWEQEIARFVESRRFRTNAEELAQIAGEFKKYAAILNQQADVATDLARRPMRPNDRTMARLLQERSDLSIAAIALGMLDAKRKNLSSDVDQIRRNLYRALPPLGNEPAELRARARAAAAASSRLLEVLEAAEEMEASLLRGDPAAGGRRPDVGMYFLVEWAERRSANVAELGRRLAARGIEPSGPGSSELDPAVRWEQVLRAGIGRLRKRGARRVR